MISKKVNNARLKILSLAFFPFKKLANWLDLEILEL